MWKLIAAVGIVGFVAWVLLYANEVAQKGALLTPVLYISMLIFPSIGLWFLVWAHAKWARGSNEASLAGGLLISSAAAVVGGAGLTILEEPSLQYSRPALSALIAATYVSGLVLFIAALIWHPRTRQWIFDGNLLGRLALGTAASLLIVFGIAKFFTESTLSARSSLFLDALCLTTLLLSFLCLLSVKRAQRMLGLAALIGLGLLIVFSRFELFFSIWLEGVLFWPFVILCTLAAEVVAFRVVLAKFFSQVVGV